MTHSLYIKPWIDSKQEDRNIGGPNIVVSHLGTYGMVTKDRAFEYQCFFLAKVKPETS